MTVNGTAGFEGILMNKPVITFDDYLFNITGLSEKFNKIDDLYPQIIELTNKINNLEQEDINNRLAKFISSVMENSFELTYPGIAFFTEFNDEHKIKKTGEELCEGFKKYLKKNHNINFK